MMCELLWQQATPDLLIFLMAIQWTFTTFWQSSYKSNCKSYFFPIPSKIRVVFNCSAKFQGRSINKELLSGPDLANQIIGVLT